MTKEEAKSKLRLMENLANEIAKLKEALTQVDTCDDYLFDTLEEIQSNETSFKEAWLSLEEYYDDDDEEITVDTPAISINDFGYITVNQPVDGGTLSVSICHSDYGTPQADIIYTADNNYEHELAFAEIKRGPIAETKGKPADNKDIDLYVYPTVYSENPIEYNYEYKELASDD
jgi:hypothetical protein